MEVISFYIALLSFIPWIPLYIITFIIALNRSDKNFSWTYFKHHMLEVFRLDWLILIIFFFFFAAFKQQFVSEYLFPVICLYLIVNSFYEKKDKLQKDFIKKNLGELIILFIIMLIPFIIYFIFGKLSLTYKIMLVMIFLEYFLVGIVKNITKHFKKIRTNNII